MAGLECDVRHLPRSQLVLKDSPSAVSGTAPLQPGELEHYDGIIFGASSLDGQLYVSH